MKNILKTYALGIALGVGVSMFMAHEAQAHEVLVNTNDHSEKTTVSGVIVNEGGQSITDAVVTVKGSSQKAKTNAKGEFKIKARKDDVLVFSAPIKESREMAVKDMKRGEKIKLEWLKSESDKVQIFVQQMPRFPFGNIIDWLVQNIRYPKRALEEKREGKVFVQYIVERDGSISNVRVLYNKSTPHFDLQEEAMRVVRSMPHWIPGVVNGRTVRVSYTLPINFTLQ